MIRARSLWFAAALAALAGACKQSEDPLAPFRAQCTQLQASGQLRAGLSLDECAKALKTSSDENDPARRAEELATRIQALVKQAQGKPGNPQDEVHLAITEIEELGKPAAPVLQAHLDASHDPDLRIAYAKALVGICFDDCQQQKFDCIVPALLEGMGKDKPSEVQKASAQGLMRCTGKDYGDDPAAWINWWSSVKAHP